MILKVYLLYFYIINIFYSVEILFLGDGNA